MQAMIRLYCQKKHKEKPLCVECERLFTYAQTRLLKCPLKENKPTCQQCPIHCYSSKMRAAVAKVMRFSGPRMILYHPLLALRHLWQSKKRVKSRGNA
jgi:hypothetical protein